MDKRVLLAAPRGYCAGVDRAIAIVEHALKLHGPPVYVRHQIVHNTHVIADLEAKGAIFVDDPGDVPPGNLLVFSAHGVPPKVREDANGHGLRTIDATCPLVAKVHGEARRYADRGYQIALIGHPTHVEVLGTQQEAPNHVTVVNPDQTDAVNDCGLDPDRPAVWLSQTTLAVNDVTDTVTALHRRLPLLIDPPTDDICYASQNRQDAVQAIARQCDLMLVVGSANSSNSRRLVEVALRAGADDAHLIDSADEIRPNWLTDVTTIGVTAGASAPETVVSDVLHDLAHHGWNNVEEVTTTTETQTFALPPHLRTPPQQGSTPAIEDLP